MLPECMGIRVHFAYKCPWSKDLALGTSVEISRHTGHNNQVTGSLSPCVEGLLCGRLHGSHEPCAGKQTCSFMAQGDLGIETGLRALCKVGKPGFEVESILLPLTEEDIGILDKRSLVQHVEIV